MLKLLHNFISHTNKVMLKIHQPRLQQYMNGELPNVQASFKKSRGTRDHIANICWITEKARESQKSIYFCFVDYTKAFDWVDHNKLWKILQEMGIPDHLTCLLRNLYGRQEATFRTGHGTTDWFQIRNGVCQGWVNSGSWWGTGRPGAPQSLGSQSRTQLSNWTEYFNKIKHSILQSHQSHFRCSTDTRDSLLLA